MPGKPVIRSSRSQMLFKIGNLKIFAIFPPVLESLFNKVAASLKVQSFKLYNYMELFHDNKYMVASTRITNTNIFAFIVALVFKLLSRKVLFINRKNNRNC